MRVRRTETLVVAAGAEALWVLPAAARPRDGALAALEAALAASGAILAAGLVVDRAGRPRADLAPRPEPHDVEGLLDAAARRTLPLRACPLVHVLVRAQALERHGPPDPRHGRYAGRAWTARVLAREPGVLVPSSVAELDPAPRRADPVAAIRALRAGAWTRGELLAAAQRAGRESRGPRTSGGPSGCMS